MTHSSLVLIDGALCQWRYRSEGPPSVKIGGHVHYRQSAVAAWFGQHAGPWG